MRIVRLKRRIPRFLHRNVLYWETTIEESVAEFAASLREGCRVLDAGAGDGEHTPVFAKHRYVGVDLGIGDAAWDYSKLDCVATLSSLPFPDGSFDACLNIVTLEHVTEPAKVLAEIARTLAPGGRFLIIVPHAWEVHQIPHDYFRYTRYGIRYLLEGAGFSAIHVYPIGGYFRLLARRLLNGLQFFRGIWFFLAAMVLCPPALVLPLFDRLDRDRNFTLGYVCTARRSS